MEIIERLIIQKILLIIEKRFAYVWTKVENTSTTRQIRKFIYIDTIISLSQIVGDLDLKRISHHGNSCSIFLNAPKSEREPNCTCIVKITLLLSSHDQTFAHIYILNISLIMR